MPLLDASSLINVTSFNVLTLGASCVTIFVTVYLSNRKMKREMKIESEGKLNKKADKTFVEKLDRAAHHRMTKIQTDGESVSKQMLKVSEDVAWIRGFLDPNKK